MRKVKVIKAWVVYGIKHSKGEILSITVDKPVNLCEESEYPYVEVEIRPIKKGRGKG